MSRTVQRCLDVSRGVQRYSELFKGVWKYPNMSRDETPSKFLPLKYVNFFQP